ncbi:reverse transcriptase domain-containing protein [Tanacetum coccineum]
MHFVLCWADAPNGVEYPFRTVGHDAAYEMPWKTMMKIMIENNFLRSEIKKLETELWNLTVKRTDVESYTQRFQELVLLCSRMVLDESDKVERYTGGFTDNIQGSVMAYKPKILQEAFEITKSLMDQKVRAYDDRQTNNKRRMDNNSRDNNAQQSSYKRQNVLGLILLGLVRRSMLKLYHYATSASFITMARAL